MSIAVPRVEDVRASDVRFDDERMYVQLVDGRELTVPIVWFRRLAEATREQRDDWRFIGRGIGIHWEQLDEDISIGGLLSG
ncbi:DUF2442 domain-containing protein [Candidatus Poribacteria bacterium]|nr:DUF2442 domain-containing protein [Candidatus Poribacteria bacterium]